MKLTNTTQVQLVKRYHIYPLPSLLGGHFVYGISDTSYLYIPHPSSTKASAVGTNSNSVNVNNASNNINSAGFSGNSMSNNNISSSDSSDESKYKALFFGMDLTKDFYFSYTYDLTHTLQYNMVHHEILQDNAGHPRDDVGYNRMFVWNDFLLSELVNQTTPPPSNNTSSVPQQQRSIWVLPIIHGFFKQESK
jgi:hypothetical protein